MPARPRSLVLKPAHFLKTKSRLKVKKTKRTGCVRKLEVFSSNTRCKYLIFCTASSLKEVEWGARRGRVNVLITKHG
jgi:hypothetical protein